MGIALYCLNGARAADRYQALPGPSLLDHFSCCAVRGCSGSSGLQLLGWRSGDLTSYRYRDSNRPANSSRRIGDGSGAIQRWCLWSHIARRSSGGSNTTGSSIRAHHRRSNQVWRGTTGNEGCSHTQSALGNFNPSQRKKRLVLSKKHDLRDRLVEEMKVRKGSPASAEGL
jgi:hypothetical protein